MDPTAGDLIVALVIILRERGIHVDTDELWRKARDVSGGRQTGYADYLRTHP